MLVHLVVVFHRLHSQLLASRFVQDNIAESLTLVSQNPICSISKTEAIQRTAVYGKTDFVSFSLADPRYLALCTEDRAAVVVEVYGLAGGANR